MAALSVVIFLYVIAAFDAVVSQQQKPSIINPGSSLSPNTAWRSPSGRFAFGFYSQGSGFRVGIWVVGLRGENNTIVWTANRDDPPVSSDATLHLTPEGKLVQRTEQGPEKEIAGNSLSLSPSSSSSFASMLDSGNFVIYGKNNSDVIWQSFDYPTDTMLGGQRLSTGKTMFSSSSPNDSSTGKYRLLMQADGNLVLYPSGSGDAYWSTSTMASNRPQYHLYLNYAGTLAIVNSTNLAQVDIIYDGPDSLTDTIHRATLDVDGIFRLYSHSSNSSSAGSNPSMLWEALDNQCKVKGFCGFNSFCTMDDLLPVCRCVSGTDYVDPNRQTDGCQKAFTGGGCRGGKEINASFYEMSAVDKLEWDEPPYYQAKMLEEDCSRSCLEDCYCDAAMFKNSFCMKQKYPLKYVIRGTSTVFFKVGGTSANATFIPKRPPKRVVVVPSKKSTPLIIGISLGLTTWSCAALAISGYLMFKTRLLSYRRKLENKNSGLSEELILQSFSYGKLRKATGGFKEELGRGAFGRVYKGTLYRGRTVVAVKRLEKKVAEGEKEFLAEMRSIGRSRHRNLVRLLGYCTDKSQRLLVYEYMSNGSLADLLFKAGRRPEWNERVRIALDIARGILYLHEECEAPIIHCDIKPQNVLMDEFWNAKISDFGLAKLLMPDQTRTFTMVRGTRGYLAPEWQQDTPISVKADVYSFGVMLLEIICCRRKLEVTISKPEEIVLSSWVHKCFAANELRKLLGGEEVDMRALERMVMVGLWCIQDEPTLRPSMKSVVLMLEGNIADISVPPCPTATPSI